MLLDEYLDSRLAEIDVKVGQLNLVTNHRNEFYNHDLDSIGGCTSDRAPFTGLLHHRFIGSLVSSTIANYYLKKSDDELVELFFTLTKTLFRKKVTFLKTLIKGLQDEGI
jgi:hypothetical protein